MRELKDKMTSMIRFSTVKFLTVNFLTVKTSIVIVSLVVVVPASALAEDAHHLASVSDLFYPAINFLLYIALMYTILNKPLRATMATRREVLAQQVSEGEVKIAQAKSELTGSETSLRNLGAEIEEMKRRISVETEKESQAILTAAREKAERIVTHAKDSALAEQKATEILLKQELAELVIRLATDKIKSRADLNRDKVLRDRALSGLKGMK